MDLVSLSYYAFTGSNGSLCSGANLFIYEENSNTVATAFLRADGTAPTRQWPVALNNNGVANVWLLQNKAYRVVVRNQYNTLILYENKAFRCGEATSESGLTSELLIRIRGKTVTYSNGRIDEVYFYKDEGKTVLVKKYKFNYSAAGDLDYLSVYNADGDYFRRRQIDRDVSGALIGFRAIEETTYGG